jgi:hypothetical protein
MRPRFISAWAALTLAVALPARAHELLRTEHGVVLEASGFYKSLLSGLAFQPGSVSSANRLAELLDATRIDPLSPATPRVPPLGALGAHLFRAGARLRLEDRIELEAAWQLALALSSDPAFAGGTSLSGTVGGTGGGAQRRLVDFDSLLAASGSARLDHNLDRLALKLALPFGDLTVGRQVLSWGSGRLWNPTDVLSPFPPTVVDREVRRGFDAVRLAVALGEVTQLDLLYLPQLDPDDMGGVIRFQHNLLGWDGALSAGKYVRDLVLGADVVGDVGPVGVHAEAAYTIELPLTGRGERFLRGVVGAELRPAEAVLLMAEYSYNGYGTSNPSRYAAILSSARVLRGEIFGAGRHQAALASAFTFSDLVSGQVALLSNLTDPSAMLIPSVEWSFTQTVLIRAGGYVPIGRGVDPSVFTALTVDDLRSASPAFRAALESRGLRSEYGSSAFGAFVQVGVYVP